VEHQVCQSIAPISAVSYVPQQPSAVLRLSHQGTSPGLRLVHTRRTSMPPVPFAVALSNSATVIAFSECVLSSLRRRRCAGRHAERTLKCVRLEVAESPDSRFRFHAAARGLSWRCCRVDELPRGGSVRPFSRNGHFLDACTTVNAGLASAQPAEHPDQPDVQFLRQLVPLQLADCNDGWEKHF
jgi:hypothetical protein